MSLFIGSLAFDGLGPDYEMQLEDRRAGGFDAVGADRNNPAAET